MCIRDSRAALRVPPGGVVAVGGPVRVEVGHAHRLLVQQADQVRTGWQGAAGRGDVVGQHGRFRPGVVGRGEQLGGHGPVQLADRRRAGLGQHGRGQRRIPAALPARRVGVQHAGEHQPVERGPALVG